MSIGRRLTAKLVALFLTAVTFAIGMHRDFEHWHVLGREAYLASRLAYFNKDMATVQPVSISLLVLLMLTGVVIFYYELLQLASKYLLNKIAA